MLTRSLTAIIALSTMALTGAWAQPVWQGWSASAPAGDGLYAWSEGAAPVWVAVEEAGAGITRVSLRHQPPVARVAARAQVSAGSVQLPGLPALRFESSGDQVRCLFTAAPGEKFRGLGMKFNGVNQRGKVVNMWVQDGFRELGDRTYLPVPMVVSSAGYGLYLDSTRRSTFNLASDGSNVVITLHGPEMSLYLWTGRDNAELLKRYCEITGFPEAPPEWAFGIWLSRSSYSEQKEVLEVARRWRALQLPLSLFNVEGWKGGCWHTFAPDRFPDPRAMISEIHSYGWRFMLWNTHNCPAGDPHFAEGDQKGYFIKDSGGKTYIVDSGYGSGGCLDVTNPEAVKWWNSLYDPLLDLGVDALFNDVTNYLDDDYNTRRSGRMVFSNGQTSDEMHNAYWREFNRLTLEYMKQRTGNDTVLRVAGGWAGQQKYSTVWAGDSGSDWEFLARDLQTVLAAGWSGLPYIGYDIPGYDARSKPVSPELYMRWVEMGAFSPMMQFHSTARTEPWHYGPEAVGVLRQFGWFRESLMPALMSLALEAQATGTPMARSLSWEFPADPVADTITDEYMLGPALLLAPVVTPGTQRRIYLPEGTWMDWMDGSRYQGPVWIDAQAPLDHVPIYLRAGGVVPQRMDRALSIGPSVRESSVTALEVYPPYDGEPASFTWYWKGGETRLETTRAGAKATVRVTGGDLPRETLLRMEVGPCSEVTVDGKRLPEIKEDELAQGSKYGYVYRKPEQVCFVRPGEDWREVALTETHPPLAFEDWEAPARTTPQAGKLRVAVTVVEAKPGTVPELTYTYLGASGKTPGKPLGKSRWVFEVPLKLDAQPQDLVWQVATVARTDQPITSRERVTVVQTPIGVSVPATLRLDDRGEFTVTVTSNAPQASRGKLLLAGPAGIVFKPAQVSFSLSGVGTARQLRVAYSLADPAAMGLGEHPLTVTAQVDKVSFPAQTILASRPLSWSLVGPFPGGDEKDWIAAFQAENGPEKGPVDLQAEFDTTAGKVRWQPYPTEWIGADGMLDIERVYGKIDFAGAYLTATFTSPVAREVLLKAGSDDALRLWLNGKLVHEFSGGRIAARDSDSVKVALQAGPNVIVAKVYDLADAWRLYLRLTDLEGKPIGDLSK